MQIIGHRGAASIAPENTAAAIRRALEAQAEWIEVDIRLSADGHWVLRHDAEIARHTRMEGKIEQLTLARLKELDFGAWFDPSFSGEKILTLQEACAMILPRARLILDIKTEADPALLAKSLRAALSGADLPRIIFSTFSFPLLAALAKEMPGCRLGYLCARGFPVKALYSAFRHFYSIHPERQIAREFSLKWAKFLGLKVFVWTVNDPEEARRFARFGADAIFTDYPQKREEFAPSGR